MKMPLALALLTLVISLNAARADMTWIGATGDWDITGNWSGGTLPTSSDGVYVDNGGTATLPSGVSGNFDSLYLGNSSGNSGTVTLTGGTLRGSFTYLGFLAGGTGSVTVSSGSWATGSFDVGNSGNGYLYINGGTVSSTSSTIGNNSASSGSVTISSGSWTNSSDLSIGVSGTGTLLIKGGTVSSGRVSVGELSGSNASITVSGGSWSASSISLGDLGTSTLLINGGTVSSGYTVIAALGGKSSVTVSSGSWINSGSLKIGNANIVSVTGAPYPGTLLVNGGTVSNLDATIDNYSDSESSYVGSSATVSGGIWTIVGNLKVGEFGSHNTLTIANKGLVKVGDSPGETITFSSGGGLSTDNHALLAGGYLALFGDQTAAVSSLIAAGDFKVWDGSSWVASTNVSDFSFSFYSTNAAAKAVTGYDNLGGYTVLTAGISLTPTPSPYPSVTPAPNPPAATFVGKRAISTTKSKQKIKGKISGDATSVNYRVGNGKWQKAKGTSNWTITVMLKPGKNIITVIASGPGGSSKPVRIVVIKV